VILCHGLYVLLPEQIEPWELWQSMYQERNTT